MLIGRKTSAGLLAAVLAATGCDESAAGEEGVDKPALGLFTSLPIYWGEGGFDSILDGSGTLDWVRAELEEDFRLEPLDALEPDMIAGLDRLFLAQPRPLAPSENVALDEWVAEGGRLVLLADPMLTRHSEYAIGDKRRPQDLVLLSPILARWGLELTFDDEQPTGERTMQALGANIPVNLRGRFEPIESAVSDCTIGSSGLVARCSRGRGEILLIADAAMLDADEDGSVSEAHRVALERILDSLSD